MVYLVVFWLVGHMVSINDTRYRTEVGVCTALGHRTATNFATQFWCSMCRHGLKKKSNNGLILTNFESDGQK